MQQNGGAIFICHTVRCCSKLMDLLSVINLSFV